ncbi:MULTISPECIES: hypothetical protein [Streptomyces]|uniref:Integral membrane protein n=1 Tax=Streptomyces hydrogenans TaxID=1873719 RepID=A0ABQ3PNJ7_9ACTN|nr:hypothetical protein [Streptomyces hydrogenans]GHG32904.1 hypothetical protein GCM10018784_52980 [Streptomyces hydrogenans]GHI26593.1 hypothetical protein Shyd_79640 [Streptomyces hydrogenans]
MSSLFVVLLVTALVLILALLTAVGAGKLARLDGASYPAALTRAAVAFAGTLTLAAAITAALSVVL